MDVPLMVLVENVQVVNQSVRQILVRVDVILMLLVVFRSFAGTQTLVADVIIVVA